MDSKDTTQRELEAATYYTWEAIKRITDVLIYLKWLVDGGKDEERAARKLDGFSKGMRDIAAIRTKFYQEQLRIAFEGAIAAIEDSDGISRDGRLLGESGGAEDDS